MKQIYLVLILALGSFINLSSQTSMLEVTSSLDNTIFKDLELSNGLGEYIFAGTTKDGVIKRALVQFDLTDALPTGTIVDSALLILFPDKVKPGSTVVTAFRLTTEWGEGSSKALEGDGKGAPVTEGDASWSHAIFPGTHWIKSGGDYDLEYSAKDTVSLGSEAVFRSEQLTLEVNFWLQNPSNNFGWILIGDEFLTSTSAKFGSRDNNDPTKWPLLKLYYQATSAVNEKDLNDQAKLVIYQSGDPSTLVIENPYNPGAASVEIYSVTGSKLWYSNTELLSGNNRLFTGNLGTGIFLYRVSLHGTTDSGKLLITDR